MIVELFQSYLLLSLLGLVLVGIYAFFERFIGKNLPPRLHLWGWLGILAVMMVPVRIALPQKVTGSVDIQMHLAEQIPIASEPILYNGAELAENIANRAYSIPWEIFATIWIVTALGLFLYKSIQYRILYKKIFEFSEKINQAFVNFSLPKGITLCKWHTKSPFLIGIRHPLLVLPAKEMNKEQLNYVLRHEIIHYQSKDLWIKWAIQIAKCVHWFNPAVYYIAKQGDLWCELACDKKVAENLAKEERKAYGETILYLLSDKKMPYFALSGGMSQNKKFLRRRFMMIKNPVIFTKKKKIIAVASMLVAFCGIFLISGALAEDILPNEKDAVVLTIEGENEKLTWPVPSSNTVSFAFSDEEGAFKHNGVDIPAETGADVVAAMDATIITQDYDTEKGYYMVLEGQNYIAEYRHLSEFALSEGAVVKAGDLVAKVGATGMATGPHVHFSLMNQKGEYLNPLEYSKEWDYERVQAAMEAQAERNEKKKQLMGE